MIEQFCFVFFYPPFPLRAINHGGTFNRHCKQMRCSPLLRQKILLGAQTYAFWPVVSLNTSDSALNRNSSELALKVVLSGCSCFASQKKVTCWNSSSLQQSRQAPGSALFMRWCQNRLPSGSVAPEASTLIG